MLKFMEETKPYSCWNKAKPTERVFVLLGRDLIAPWTIIFWCILRILAGKNHWADVQIQEALECAKLMKQERKRNGKEQT